MARDEPASLVGRQLGAYRVLSRIAAGGMGEVFLARDERLGRDVALKTLPVSSLDDEERVARFEREARLLATLNHPHIAAIYGFVEDGPLHALVLELVDGPTLSERLAAGPLPMKTALTIARDIASALEAAHEKGIVHRDLKPANIKLTTDGAPKVLDFGIAKMTADAAAAGDRQTVAATELHTREGAVLGTAGYMSPEQVRGHAVDRRTDLWAFGCVLFEMLTARAAFGRDTRADIAAAVLEREPDWRLLPATTPPAVRRLLQRCLQKDPKQRLRDAGDARLDIEEALAAPAAATDRPHTIAQVKPLTWAALGLVVLASVTAVVWVVWTTRADDAASLVTRATLTLPAAHSLDTNDRADPLAVAPDGRRIAYAASTRGGPVQLYVRTLDAFEPRALAGTEGANHPFFSPDGQSLAFVADGKLKRISLAGGAPVPLCDVPPLTFGGTWGPDGTIIFDAGLSGLLRIASTGGTPEKVRTSDPAMDNRNLRAPRFLPGGRALVLSAVLDTGLTLAALSLDTGKWHLLGRGDQPMYVAPGYLVFHAVDVREGEIHAVEFDIDTLTTRGEPFAVLEGTFRARSGGAAYFAAAESGTAIFAPGGLAHTLVRVDRNGRRTPLSEDRRGFRFPHVSPDGRQVAVTIDPRPSQIWIYDLERQSRRRISGDGHSIGSAWTPDGQRIAYFSRGDMHWRASDASSAEERLLDRPRSQYAGAWSPDGRLLLFTDDHELTRGDIWGLPLGGQPTPYVVGPAIQNNPKLSADGRWLAYTSNESGRQEVHVRPFPNVKDGDWVISADGGHTPAWSRSGGELFYMTGNTVMSVAIDTRGRRFVARRPAALFSGPFDTTQANDFDVAPDGNSFVMVEADPDQRPTRLHVIVNWATELARMAAARRP